jgi:hypothetical protein
VGPGATGTGAVVSPGVSTAEGLDSAGWGSAG